MALRRALKGNGKVTLAAVVSSEAPCHVIKSNTRGDYRYLFRDVYALVYVNLCLQACMFLYVCVCVCVSVCS